MKKTTLKIFSLIILNCLVFTACTKKADDSTPIKETTSIDSTLAKVTDTANAVATEATKAVKVIEKKTEEIKEKAKATITIKKKEKRKVDNTNIMTIKLKTGTVKIKLRPDLAPKHVKRITDLSNKGFYDGLKFHRVIEGFMAQTGDPKGDGTGGSDLPNLESEFSPEPFDRGVLGMARSASPHSANSQFFIMLDAGHFLNNNYTVFGEVISGMEHVDKIKLGDKAANGSVSDPDTMIKVSVGE